MRPRYLAVTLALLAPALALATGFRLWVVRDLDMAPTLEPGDLVIGRLGQVPSPHQVAMVSDPTDPRRRIFRRVIAGPGAMVASRGGTPVVAGASLRQVEMGRGERSMVLMEAEHHLVIRDLVPTRSAAPAVTVPEEHLWLAGDNRPVALDSRHWGPLPEEEFSGVALLRLGRPRPWLNAVKVP